MRPSLLTLSFCLMLLSGTAATAWAQGQIEAIEVAPPSNPNAAIEPDGAQPQAATTAPAQNPNSTIESSSSPTAAEVVQKQGEIQVEGQAAPEDQVLPPVQEMAPAEMEHMQYAVLRTIDKLSARTHTFDVALDKTVKFGDSLFIKLRSCRKSSPIDQPESAAFLQIWEKKTPDQEPNWVFSGWMFASSPSLSAMDHPVYDVWVIECKNAETSAKPAAAPASAKPAPKSAPVSEEEVPEEEAPPSAE